MSIKEIFETMDYGPAPEDSAEALAWLVDQGSGFGHFIDGAFTKDRPDFETRNPANGNVLATLTQATPTEVAQAVEAARRAQPQWSGLSGHERARYLYALARLMQKHARLLAVLETLDNGKPIRESRDIDVPLAQRHFYYHAGMAQLMDSTLPDRQPIGVCGQIIPWNFPLLMLAWKVAPALAMGNTVVLKPAEWTSLTALLFADLCRQAGLPPGVVNIVTGDGAVGAEIVGSDVDKIAFTGSTEVGREIRKAIAGSGKALTLELGGKSPFIVFDDADLDSAVEGIVDAIWFNQGQVCCAGSRLLVHEPISHQFHDKLRARMETLRVGDPLDKCIDMGAIVDPVHLERITQTVGQCDPNAVHASSVQLPGTGCYYPPTLITGLSPSDDLMQDEVFGPVLVSTTFRTPSEAVQLANNTRYGLAASVWSENINLALDVAPKLAAGVVWVNCTNVFDAAAGFGGVRESGFGREGGWEGLHAYTKPKESIGVSGVAPTPISGDQDGQPMLDRTYKLYIGGKQARPDGGYVQPVWAAKGELLGHVPVANRKDVRNAVEAATGAAAWAKTTGHLRVQILFYLAENLSARADEFAAKLDAATGKDNGAEEVEAAIKRLFTYAAWADKFSGDVRNTPQRGLALALREPVGVIAAGCSHEAPLLGMISLLAPAIALGNRIVLCVSEAFPLPALELYQILETSDIPAGVVNLLSGPHADTLPHLAGHLGVDAIWSFSDPSLGEQIETAAAGNLKRTWVSEHTCHDWFSAAAEGAEFLEAATEVKTVWVPYGE